MDADTKSTTDSSLNSGSTADKTNAPAPWENPDADWGWPDLPGRDGLEPQAEHKENRSMWDEMIEFESKHQQIGTDDSGDPDHMEPDGTNDPTVTFDHFLDIVEESYIRTNVVLVSFIPESISHEDFTLLMESILLKLMGEQSATSAVLRFLRSAQGATYFADQPPRWMELYHADERHASFLLKLDQELTFGPLGAFGDLVLPRAFQLLRSLAHGTILCKQSRRTLNRGSSAAPSLQSGEASAIMSRAAFPTWRSALPPHTPPEYMANGATWPSFTFYLITSLRPNGGARLSARDTTPSPAPGQVATRQTGPEGPAVRHPAKAREEGMDGIFYPYVLLRASRPYPGALRGILTGGSTPAHNGCCPQPVRMALRSRKGAQDLSRWASPGRSPPLPAAGHSLPWPPETYISPRPLSPVKLRWPSPLLG